MWQATVHYLTHNENDVSRIEHGIRADIRRKTSDSERIERGVDFACPTLSRGSQRRAEKAPGDGFERRDYGLVI